MAPPPPEVVTMVAVRTAWFGQRTRLAASSIIESRSSISMMPFSRQMVSSAWKLPARLAVWENAALAPLSVRPAFTISQGLPRERARFARARKRCGFLMPST